MNIQIVGKQTIEASAERVWQVVADEYADIGQWASAITASTAVSGAAVLENAPVCGRVCGNNVAGFGDVVEQFTAYDESAMRFSYAAVQGLPSLVKRAVNNWSVRSLGKNRSEVVARGEIELAWLPGLLLAPLLKWQMGRLGQQTMDELKYYVENGHPHPRKAKMLAKRAE